ncbi:MAG TPA: glycine--tRNA ligase subunit beta, partial [Thermodesulfovibrionales bacterium]|nr:glycine--tRNA ligase subunit beta [Thermodesulfovibrionales bacterium]
AIQNLKENASAILRENYIEFAEIKTYATPRRLVLVAAGLPDQQASRVREIFGPPKRVAFDEGGNPTEAAVRFANSQGVKAENLIVKKKDKGEYVAAVVEEKGLAVKDLLPEVLKKIVLSIRFSKAMRWGNGSLRFARPIHWLLAMFDKDIMRFELDGVKSSNITWGHRFLSRGRFQIKEVSDFRNLLENNFVIVDQEQRRKIILEGIRRLAALAGGKPIEDEELVETVNFLVEYPFPVLCSFQKEYLELPKELLVTVMKDHQKFFAIEDEEGRLINYFIVISNTKKENEEIVRIGAERVIKARFEDAKFYFREDRKKNLNERIGELSKVIFQEKLGSLHKKTERIVSIAAFLSERLMPLAKEKILRAAWLSKTDLSTGIIREFTELQGVMGKYYALHDGEDSEIAMAIEEQYLPKHSGGTLPSTEIGAFLSVADKIDNIASFFCLGLIPTGSEDPFALRRQALGIIAIMLDKGYDISLKDLIDRALQNLASLFPLPEQTGEKISQFFEQRLEPVFSERGYDSDLIQSILSLSVDQTLKDVDGRLDALKRFKEEKTYNSFLLAIKRVHNILPRKTVPELKTDLLIEDAEKNLLEKLNFAKPNLSGFLAEKKYYDAIDLLSFLTDPINQFFDHVLVMDKREEIKQNRFALLREVWKTASTIADLSRLQAS